MRYEVRFIVDGNEQSQIVDGETAAEAADTVRNQNSEDGKQFELIQVQLLDEPSTTTEQGALEQA
ncbi:MAG TPA: hypothetical protein VNZ58_12375 [Thermomicrobiales bacterium]|nr:hypothetical protein [Thermomicrobiales bacterium]